MCAMLMEPLPETSQTAAWDNATARFDRWRGACIGAFASAEAIVTETLLWLAQSPDRFGTIKLPMLVGPKYDTAMRVIKAHAAFGGHGSAALKKLAQFRRHDALRTALCHGDAQITLDRRGNWVAIIRMTVLRPNGAEKSVSALTPDEASAQLNQLRADAVALGVALGQIRKCAATEVATAPTGIAAARAAC